MGFNSNTPRQEFTASAGQTEFIFNFKVFLDSDITAYQTLSGNLANDTDDLLILGADYTITIDGDNGGTLTLLNAASDGDQVTIKRDLPITRDTDYQNGGDFLAETIDQDQDYQTYLLQQIKTNADRSLVIPEAIQSFDTTLPNPEAGKYLKIKADGTGIEYQSFTNSTNITTIINTIADFRQITNPSDNPIVWVSGYHSKGDGAFGSNIFEWDNTSTEDDNGGTIIKLDSVATGRYKLRYRGAINVKWFGAIAYATKSEAISGIDSYFAFENAIKELGVIGGTIEMPRGYIKSLSTIRDDIFNILISGVPITLVGQGASEVDGEGTTILTQGAIVGIQFDGNRSGGRNFKIEGDNGAFDGISHGIIANSSRAHWHNVLSTKHRGDGFLFRFGNNSQFSHITTITNKGNGFNADGTGYVAKNGTPRPNDLNASTFTNIDCRANGLKGFRTGANSGFSNFIYGLTVQGNAGKGAEFNGNYYRVFGFYGESNDSEGNGSDISFGSTADYNKVYGIFSNSAPSWEDLSANKRNYIDEYDTQTKSAHVQDIVLGENTTPNGHLIFSGEGDSVNPSITLEETSTTQTIDIKSSGTGKLGINPQFIVREEITNPTLLNSWVNYGGTRQAAGFWKDKESVVHLEGVIKSGTTTSPTILFNLPAGYRPSLRNKFATVSNSAFASIFIDTDGNVYYESGSNVEFSLCGISFKVEQ